MSGYSPNETLTRVYMNIWNFMKYRDIEPYNEPLRPEEFIEDIYKNDYVVIEANKKINVNGGIDKPVRIILIHHTAQQTMKTNDYKSIVSKLGTKWGEIIFVTQTNVTSHVAKFLTTMDRDAYRNKEFTHCEDHELKWCTCAKTTVYNYLYDKFIIEAPKHILMPEYRVLNLNEEREMLEAMRLKKSALPLIKKSDTMVVWSNAIKGSIIEIIRNDDVAGKSIYYRLVV